MEHESEPLFLPPLILGTGLMTLGVISLFALHAVSAQGATGAGDENKPHVARLQNNI
jgi:hypothetical protein